MSGIDGDGDVDVYDNRVSSIACGDKNNAFPSKYILSAIWAAAAPVCVCVYLWFCTIHFVIIPFIHELVQHTLIIRNISEIQNPFLFHLL